MPKKNLKNTLYHYIDYITKTGLPIDEMPKCLSEIVKKDDKNYMIIKLPNTSFHHSLKNITGINLKITEHHITVFADEDPSAPHKGQYHYTAIFGSSSKNKQQYRLHVFFNINGDVTTVPELKKIVELSKNLEPSIQLDEMTQAAFIELAQRSTQPCLIDLNEKYAKTVNTIKKQYEQKSVICDKLSVNLFGNLDLYLINIAQLINIAETLASLEQGNFFQGKYRFLTQLKSSLLLSRTVEQKQQQASKTSKDDELNLLPQRVTDDIETAQSTASKDTILYSKNTEAEMINELSSRWVALKKQPPTDEYPTELSNLLRTLYEQYIILQDKSDIGPIELNRMFRLISEVEGHIKETLTQYLDANNIEFANKVTGIGNLLTEDQVIHAIKNNRPEVLDYLLTQGSFDINLMRITSDNQQSMSLASYCFMLHRETNPLFQCLEVLIKHNIGLLDKQPSGLPLAYHIDRSNNITLKSAVSIQYVGKTEFYQCLINTMRFYLSTHQDDCTDTEEIQHSIDSWQSTIDTYIREFNISKSQELAATKILTNLYAQRAEDIANQAFKESPKYQRLKADPDIIASEADIEAKSKQIAIMYSKISDEVKQTKLQLIMLKKLRLDKNIKLDNERKLMQEKEKNGIFSDQYKDQSFDELKRFTLVVNTARNSLLGLDIKVHSLLLEALAVFNSRKTNAEEALLLVSKLPTFTKEIDAIKKDMETYEQILNKFNAKKYKSTPDNIERKSLSTEFESPAQPLNPNVFFTPPSSTESPVNTSQQDAINEVRP